MKSGARGPGVFFIIPCVDHYEKIDMRTQTYDVPPQEVQVLSVKHGFFIEELNFERLLFDFLTVGLIFNITRT